MPNPTNDQIIFDTVLGQAKQSRAPEMTDADFFEIYVASQVLKDFDLSDEEINSGIVGGGNDGGIDSLYAFINGDLVREDSDLSSLKKDVTLEIYVMQSKTTNGFSDTAIQKLQTLSADIFDLSKKLSDLKHIYNEGLLKAAELIRNTYKTVAVTFPKLRFTYIYATKSDGKIHPAVHTRRESLLKTIKLMFSSAEVDLRLLGSPDLLALGQKRPKTSFKMKFTEAIFTKEGIIALVELTEFHRFLVGESGHLQKHLFESNVRDYQGSNSVNEEIQSGLIEKSKEDFWWLNNGVTIIARKHAQSSKELTIEEPQIVNGLQTSTEIAKYFKSGSATNEDRKLLVRVITPEDAESSDRIIKATNSQTPIPEASLRATEKVHRDIEEYLKPFGIYYDRRKNSYRNEGRPIASIVSIPTMAQAIMSLVLQRPNDARARPSSLLKKDEDYNRIFSLQHPISLYSVGAQLTKLAKAALKDDNALQAKDRNNLLFYCVMSLACLLTNKSTPSVSEIAKIDIEKCDAATVQDSVQLCKELYAANGGTDQLAKGTALVEKLKAKLSNRFPPKHHKADSQ
jgi:hypothetical protein